MKREIEAVSFVVGRRRESPWSKREESVTTKGPRPFVSTAAARVRVPETERAPPIEREKYSSSFIAGCGKESPWFQEGGAGLGLDNKVVAPILQPALSRTVV